MAKISAVKELLLETLNELSYEEQKNFRWFLQFRVFQRSLPFNSRLQTEVSADLLVDLMMEMFGQQSVEVTKEVLMDMNKTDLVQRLSESSSGPTGQTKKTTTHTFTIIVKYPWLQNLF